jgi:hypothetical protein
MMMPPSFGFLLSPDAGSCLLGAGQGGAGPVGPLSGELTGRPAARQACKPPMTSVA